jgi:hypothetical protein
VIGCGFFSNTDTKMMRHFTVVHKVDPEHKFRGVLCFYDNCDSRLVPNPGFNSVTTLYNHLRTSHKDFQTSTKQKVILFLIFLFMYM